VQIVAVDYLTSFEPVEEGAAIRVSGFVSTDWRGAATVFDPVLDPVRGIEPHSPYSFAGNAS